MRDFQRSKLYAWETLEGLSQDGCVLTLAECTALVNRVWREHRPRWWLRYLEVRDGRGRRRGAATAYWVKLPKWARNETYVLHEIAHALCEAHDENDHHGPNFVARYIGLLALYAGRDGDALRRSARDFGLKVAP